RIMRREALALVAADRLNDEQVGPADRLAIAAVDLAVGEGLQAGVGEAHSHLLGDARPELAAGAAGGDHQPLVVTERQARRERACLSPQATHLMRPLVPFAGRNPRRFP